MAAVPSARRPSAMRPGFLILEALIGFALFALFLTAAGLTVLVSQQGTSAAADRARAIALTSGALQGVSAIRDSDWADLQTGTHGMAIIAGAWAFSGSMIQTDDGFRTWVELAEPEDGRMTVTVTTEWPTGESATGSVVLHSELTDWRTPKPVGNWTAPQEVGTWSTTETPLFEQIAVGSSVAAVTSDSTGGGNGLYLFDLSNPSSPTPIATSFDLGFSGHDVLIAGTTLYVITEHPSQELQIYSLADPQSFGAASLLASYDLPGDGQARSLALHDAILSVGLLQSATDAELYLFDVSDPSDPYVEGALDLDGGVIGIAALDDALFLATDDDVAEVRSVDVSNPAQPLSSAGSGYNLADVTDARTIAVTGTSAIIGRSAGEFVEELVIFQLQNGGDLSPPGPWYWDVGDVVHGLAIDPSQTYGFAATAYPSREFSVLDLAAWRDGDQAIVGSIASATGEARDVSYDPAADRAYVITRSSLSVYRPQ